MIKVLIVDDYEIVREGLKRILNGANDLTVVGEAQNGEEALLRIQDTECDVLVLDMNMPGKCGVELLEEVKHIKPNLHVLILTIQPEDKFALRILKAGASGYLSKDTALDELVGAIRKIYEKGRYISPNLKEQLAFAIFKDDEMFRDEHLSGKEQLILSKIASGLKIKEIATELGISVSTVFAYRMKIFEKVHVKNNVELTHYAIERNLVNT